MMKMVLAVFLSLAVMAMCAEALSTYEDKMGQWDFGGEMTNGEMKAVKRDVPAACTRVCDCANISRRSCNYCRYLKHLCIQIYGNVVDA